MTEKLHLSTWWLISLKQTALCHLQTYQGVVVLRLRLPSQPPFYYLHFFSMSFCILTFDHLLRHWKCWLISIVEKPIKTQHSKPGKTESFGWNPSHDLYVRFVSLQSSWVIFVCVVIQIWFLSVFKRVNVPYFSFGSFFGVLEEAIFLESSSDFDPQLWILNLVLRLYFQWTTE